MFISNVKGVPKVVQVGVLVQLGEVDEVWPIVVDQEIEPKPVLPRQREVLDVNMLVSVRSSLTPEQQGLLRRHLLRRLPGSRFVVIDVDLDLLDLETEDDRPDETEDHPWVPVHNVFGSDVLKTHFGVEEGEGFVDIFDPEEKILDFQDNRAHFSTIRYP